jgi:dCTP diphosphatase
MQWKGEVENGLPGWPESEREHLGEELSDVLIYLVSLADKCGVDLSRHALQLCLCASSPQRQRYHCA